MANFHPMSNHIALQMWQPFLRDTHPVKVKSDISALRRLCDAESQEEISTFLERVQFHPSIKDRHLFKIDYRSVAERTRSKKMTAEVQRLPKLDVPALRAEYDLVDADIDDNFIRPESFVYRSGLSYVADADAIIGNRAIIDGGGYRGESAVIFAKNFPESEVHVFEPDRTNFAILKTITASNRYGMRIVPVMKGLSNSSGLATSDASGHGFRITGKTAEVKGIELTTASIDDYVEETGIEIGCLKLDVEGAEYDAICGAETVIRRDRPILLISIYHTPRDFLYIAPILDKWDLGYKFRVRHLHPQLTSFFGEFMLIAVPQRQPGGGVVR